MRHQYRCWITVCALAWFGVAFTAKPVAIAARAAEPPVAFCAAPHDSHAVAEPPDVEMWRQPRNAAGIPELVLAVHRQGDRFCYTYRLGGVRQSVAPTIRVRHGERFAIRIVNEIVSPSEAERAASTRVAPCMPMPMPASAPVERFTGYMNHTIEARFSRVKPIDTNLHLHGFVGPASEEDVFVSTLGAPMHACEYTVTIPAAQPSGTYFYHPHAHGASFDEVAGHLAGIWIVEPDAAPIARADEHVVTIRYRIPFVSDNPFAPDFGNKFFHAALAREAAVTQMRPSPVPYDPFDPPAWPLPSAARLGNDVAFDGCNGVYPSVLMSVDGADTPAVLDVPAGRSQLLRVVNATSDTALALALHDRDGRLQPMHVVGLDGTPVSGDNARTLSRYLSLNRLMLPPAGRADLLVRVPEGDSLTLASEHYCEGFSYVIPQPLLHLEATPGSANAGDATILSAPAILAQTAAARLVAFAQAHRASIRRRALAFTAYAIPKRGKIRAHNAFYITDITNPAFHEHPFWPVYARDGTVPTNPDIVVKRGTVEEWYLINADSEVHTFHIHQMSFVLERGDGGFPMTRDTIVLPLGHIAPNPRAPDYPLMHPSITKVLLDFRHVARGTFVFHCHMLFHEDRGMMGIIRVE